MDTGICNKCSALKFFPSSKNWRKIRSRLNTIVKFPSENGKFRLSTYGIEEIGEVPRFPFVIRLTPREFTNKPTKKDKISLYLFCFCTFHNFCSLSCFFAVCPLLEHVFFYGNIIIQTCQCLHVCMYIFFSMAQKEICMIYC